MESLKPNVLLDFNENQLEDVRRNCNYNVNRLVQDINIFEDWIAKQNHFRVRKFDREYLERYLIYNKGSIERAKNHLDRLCTYKNLMPEFLQNYDLRNEFGPIRSCSKFAMIPKPSADNYRVAIASIHGSHAKFDVATYYKYIVAIIEFALHHDYCNGWEVIFDTREMPYSMLTRLNPIVISKALSLIVETMGQRVKAFHFLSGSKVFDTVLILFKQAMSKKLAKRVQVHDSLESIHRVVDKDSLPLEYGGKGKPMQQYDDDIFKEVSSDEHIARMKFLESASTDESRRLSSKFNEEYCGTAGSFKTMVLDWDTIVLRQAS